MKSEVVSGLAKAAWPVFLMDAAGVIHDANEAAVRTFGPNIANGSAQLATIWLTDNEVPAEEFLARLGQSPVGVATMKLLGIKGVSLNQQAALCIVMEAGQNYTLVQLPGIEAGLIYKQKQDRALQLARTVALDFNNALTSILGYTSLILGKIEPNNPWRRPLMEVEKSANRAAEIANDLAAFSRNEKETKVQQSGNVNLLLERNVEAFQSAKQEKEVTWEMKLERRLYSTKFDEGKMQMALMKIMENAIEAMGPRGRVVLQTRNIDLTASTQDRNAQLAAGSYVCAEIADNGPGIEAEVLPRIFEPFFTTKRDAKHRGLGLAWVYGVVTNHGGAVAISSQVGTGTSVRVYLPADKKFVKDDGPAGADLKGDQTILMVDDEDLLLTMGKTVLSEYGYRVVTANSGAKALEILSKNERKIDLLITDLVMPNMGGRELVEQARRISPEMAFVCSSGYVRPGAEEQERTTYLQKPFSAQELLLKVKQALSSQEAGPVD